jgi:hypothetical protein
MHAGRWLPTLVPFLESLCRQDQDLVFTCPLMLGESTPHPVRQRDLFKPCSLE